MSMSRDDGRWRARDSGEVKEIKKTRDALRQHPFDSHDYLYIMCPFRRSYGIYDTRTGAAIGRGGVRVHSQRSPRQLVPDAWAHIGVQYNAYPLQRGAYR